MRSEKKTKRGKRDNFDSKESGGEEGASPIDSKGEEERQKS